MKDVEREFLKRNGSPHERRRQRPQTISNGPRKRQTLRKWRVWLVSGSVGDTRWNAHSVIYTPATRARTPNPIWLQCRSSVIAKPS